MSEFKEYIDSILNGIATDDKNKKDISDEIEDHLKLLKQEYVGKGYSGNEAVKMAIKSFGEVKDIRAKYAFAYNHFNKYICIPAIILFVLYVLALIQISLFKYRYIGFDTVNLVPFKSITFYLVNPQKVNYDVWFSNLFGVVIAFIPFGFLIPIIYHRMKKIHEIIIVSISFSIFIEIFQHITAGGVADIDDVILNTLGSILGFILLNVIIKLVLLLKNLIPNKKMTEV